MTSPHYLLYFFLSANNHFRTTDLPINSYLKKQGIGLWSFYPLALITSESLDGSLIQYIKCYLKWISWEIQPILKTLWILFSWDIRKGNSEVLVFILKRPILRKVKKKNLSSLVCPIRCMSSSDKGDNNTSFHGALQRSFLHIIMFMRTDWGLRLPKVNHGWRGYSSKPMLIHSAGHIFPPYYAEEEYTNCKVLVRMQVS